MTKFWTNLQHIRKCVDEIFIRIRVFVNMRIICRNHLLTHPHGHPKWKYWSTWLELNRQENFVVLIARNYKFRGTLSCILGGPWHQLWGLGVSLMEPCFFVSFWRQLWKFSQQRTSCHQYWCQKWQIQMHVMMLGGRAGAPNLVRRSPH